MTRNEKILLGAGIGTTILWVLTKNGTRNFGPLVPYQRQRGNDIHGSGAFGASRDGGTRIHNGVDIVAQVGQAVKSPVDGKVIRYPDVYSDNAFTGLAIDTDAYLHKILYVAPSVSVGSYVKKGQTIGYAQNIAGRYPGITPHVHWEVWDKSKMNVAINPLK